MGCFTSLALVICLVFMLHVAAGTKYSMKGNKPYRLDVHEIPRPKASRQKNFFEMGKINEKNVAPDPLESYLTRSRKLDDWDLGLSCDLCEQGIVLAQTMVKNGTSRADIVKFFTDQCIERKIHSERVCSLKVPLFQDEVLYVLSHLTISPAQACGLFMATSCTTPYWPGEWWNVTFPNKPKPTPKPPTPPKPDAPTMRFVHLTDIHIDFGYKEGSNVDCSDGLCCRFNDNFTDSSSHTLKAPRTAGKYGTVANCDIPMILAENLFQHLSLMQDEFDYVIFTGDIPAHDTWNQSKIDQLQHVTALDRLFSTYLPRKPWYACIGNHESSPIASFPSPGTPDHDNGWLYGAFAEVWGKWLPDTSLDEVLRCGGYSFSPYPGFRIISINDNYCNIANWWLLLGAKDPCNVLQWLVDELQSAEDKGEKVHILMHIPPGLSTCLKPWSYNFYQIVNRYENTIMNQFYGHTHSDYYNMFYDVETLQRPVGFAFVLTSVTTDADNMPIYRIYTMDGNYPNSSWAVLDYTSYYLNVTEANLDNRPFWQFEYSPKTAYNMNSLYAADWEDLLQRMEKEENDDLFQLFYKHHVNLYPKAPCTGTCKKDLLCSIKEARSYDPDLCTTHK